MRQVQERFIEPVRNPRKNLSHDLLSCRLSRFLFHCGDLPTTFFFEQDSPMVRGGMPCHTECVDSDPDYCFVDEDTWNCRLCDTCACTCTYKLKRQIGSPMTGTDEGWMTGCTPGNTPFPHPVVLAVCDDSVMFKEKKTWGYLA